MKFQALLIFCLLGGLPWTVPAQETEIIQDDFAVDPGWISFRSRLMPEQFPEIRQEFGYQASNHAGGENPGETGGTIQRAITRAIYAKPIPTRTLNEPLSASGKFAVTRAGGSSGAMLGWFNQNSKGWRTPNSLGFRIDGNGGKYWLFYEYGTQSGKTAGGGAYEGERYQTTKTAPFQADGTVHRWSLKYDPRKASEPGLCTFQVDDRVYTLEVSPEHKQDGAQFDRFGLWNVQIAGDSLDVWVDDLVIDGKAETFSQNPNWEANGNQTSFKERFLRPYHQFGYSNTSHAGGKSGEIGGIIYRDERPAFYAAPTGPLSLEKELHASGRVTMLSAAADSGVYLGWFNGKDKRNKQVPEHDQRQPNYLGIMIEGPSRVGHYFRPVWSDASGAGEAPLKDPVTGAERPVIRPDGKPHLWSLDFLPEGAGGKGEIRFTFDGKQQTLPLPNSARQTGARFDHFGLFNIQSGGHHVEVYLDDLKFTRRINRKPSN